MASGTPPLCKVGKCAFDLTTAGFLGHMISPQEIQMDPDVAGLSSLKLPRDLQQFKSFANYYCCFIKDFTAFTVPLLNLLKAHP